MADLLVDAAQLTSHLQLVYNKAQPYRSLPIDKVLRMKTWEVLYASLRATELAINVHYPRDSGCLRQQAGPERLTGTVAGPTRDTNSQSTP